MRRLLQHAVHHCYLREFLLVLRAKLERGHVLSVGGRQTPSATQLRALCGLEPRGPFRRARAAVNEKLAKLSHHRTYAGNGE